MQLRETYNALALTVQNTAATLASDSSNKAVIARGAKEIPNSVKLWMQAAKLDLVVELLANEEDARLLLQRVVDRFPLNVKLWLTLARLEAYKNARKH